MGQPAAGGRTAAAAAAVVPAAWQQVAAVVARHPWVVRRAHQLLLLLQVGVAVLVLCSCRLVLLWPAVPLPQVLRSGAARGVPPQVLQLEQVVQQRVARKLLVLLQVLPLGLQMLPLASLPQAPHLCWPEAAAAPLLLQLQLRPCWLLTKTALPAWPAPPPAPVCPGATAHRVRPL